MNTQEFLAAIKGADAEARYRAWIAAGPQGASAIVGLAEAMASGDRWVARAARFALERIAHHAARPGARREAQAVAAELLKVAVSGAPDGVRSHAVHLLGFVSEGRNAGDLGKLLDEAGVRDEARMALERLPGRDAHRTLERAAERESSEFKAALQQSVENRNLGMKTVGIRPNR